MEKPIFFAIVVTVLFFLLKFLESKYLEKDVRQLKQIIRDACLVFVATMAVLLLGFTFDAHVNDFLGFLTGAAKHVVPEKAFIFTGEPEF